MTPEKIISVVEMYEKRLREAGVGKIRMEPSKSFAELNKDELLAHAHYLCDGVKEYAKDPERQGKTGRHLGSLQTLLSVAGWYTLDMLMRHNMPR